MVSRWPGASDPGPPKIDSSVPHSARIWNYWLGGKDNFDVDRAAGDEVAENFPHIGDIARQCRAFLGRAVRHLAGAAGIDQFLDIGTGLPTAENTHQVAQRIQPRARVVYVDNDPLVLAHARALLPTIGRQGVTDYIDADVRDPARILRAAARTLDLRRPTALMLLGILEFIPDDDEASGIVKRLVDALPSGSHLVVSDATSLVHGDAHRSVMRLWTERGGTPIVARTPEQIGGFFDGLDLLDPGVVSVSRWRPGGGPHVLPDEVDAFGGVGRKP